MIVHDQHGRTHGAIVAGAGERYIVASTDRRRLGVGERRDWITAVARLHRDILRTLLGRIAAGNPPAGAKLPKEPARPDRYRRVLDAIRAGDPAAARAAMAAVSGARPR